jgi:NADH:ubiquinone oxidoreductase subunit E
MNPAELRERLRPTVESYLHPEAALLPSLHVLLDAEESIDEEKRAVLAEMCGVEVGAVEKLLRHHAVFQKPQSPCATLCFGTVCYLRGAKEVRESLRLHLSSGDDFVEEVGISPCLGHCYAAPVFRMSDGTLHQVMSGGEEGSN